MGGEVRNDSEDATGTSRLRSLAIAASAVAAFTGLVSLLYATSIWADAADSDKATTILVGQDISNGHLLLHGWILPPGNYWTTDAAFYAFAAHFVGLRPELLYVEPAIVAAITIFVGVLIAIEGRRGSAAAAGTITVVALLAFATPAMASWFVGTGFHVATALYALVVLGALRRGRFGWGWALAVALIAFGMLGDLMIVAYAVLPLIGLGVVTRLRERSWRGAIAPITAAVAGVGIGELTFRLAEVLGAFRSGSPLPIANPGQILANLVHVFTYGADLVGLTNGRFATGGVPLALLGVHAVGFFCMVACLLVALTSLVAGIVRARRRDPVPDGRLEPWRLDDMLLIATLGSAAPFIFLAGPNGIGIHFLVAPVLFASVLTGRTVAWVWPELRTGWPVRALATAGMAASLSFGAGLGYELAQPEPTPAASSLAAWLEAHHLHNGIGGYWSAAITTVESHGAVTVRPVTTGKNGDLQRLMFQTPAKWYAGQRFEFFVYAASKSDRDVLTSATRTFGRPAHIYVVGPYRVVVWGHRLKIATFPPV